MNFQLKDGVLHHTEDCKECGGTGKRRILNGHFRDNCNDCKDGKVLVKIKPEKPRFPRQYRIVESAGQKIYEQDKKAYQEQTRLSTLLTEALKVKKPLGYEPWKLGLQTADDYGAPSNALALWRRYDKAQKTLSLYKGVGGIIVKTENDGT